MNTKRAANNTLVIGSTALGIASTFGGVPFAGPIVALLGELARCCEQVQIYKAECSNLFRSADLILTVLRDGSSGLESTSLQEAADALAIILVDIKDKMLPWTTWNILRSFWKRDEIFNGVRRAVYDLQVYQERFHIQAQITTLEKLHQNHERNQRDHDEVVTVLRKILKSQESTNSLLQMRLAGEPAVEEVMRAAQTELHEHPKDSPKYLEYEGYVLNLYKTTGIMPTVPNLSHEVVLKNENGPIAGGPYSEVSLGIWLGKVDVALKYLRAVTVSIPRAQKKFEHEIAIWHNLEHPNILRFLGLVDNLGPHICVVSPWQSNGNAFQYTKENPAVDRLRLLAGAARGIEYLHGRYRPVVHGNLKCANILVSDQGEALISDFGLSRVIEDITETAAYTTLTSSGSNRWCAPELMNEISSPTLATDVYSFSMAMLECLTSERPFAHLRRDPVVVIRVMQGERPRPPVGVSWDRWFTEELWDLLQRCWNHDPALRPLMTDIAVELAQLGQQVGSRHSESNSDNL